MIDSWIIKIKLYNNKFFPYIEMLFRDASDTIADQLHPLDDSIISFFRRVESEILMPLRLDFHISNFRILKNEPGENNDKIYSIRGNLFFNNITEIRSYRGTSFAVLQKIAKIAELGFASNIENTNDEMVWINPGNYLSEFIPDIVRYSYHDDDSFLFSFIDLYYNLNYIDIEKQLSENTMDQRSVWNEGIFKEGEEIVTPLLLTNHPNMASTNMYIDKFNLENSAYDVNWEIGYDAQIYFYDKTTNTTSSYQLDTISNPSTDKIVLKSYEKKTNTRIYNMGFQDQDNVHENFLYSKKQNENNIEFLQKIKMNIVIQNPNMSIYRFQNVELVLYELNKPYEGDDAKKQSHRINERLSGAWLIVGINYIFEKNNFYQEITLVKRELTSEYNKEKLEQLTANFNAYK